MRIHDSIRKSDRIDAAIIGADSRFSEPRSASIHLLSSSTRAGRDQRNVRSRRVAPELWNETVELRTHIDGSPVLVRLLIEDMPAEMRSSFSSNGDDIHSLLSSTLEKMIGRARVSPLRTDAAASRQLPAIVEPVTVAESSAGSQALPNEIVLRVGPLELDLLDRTAKRGGRKIDLRPREFRLLKYMMQQHDTLLTRAALLKDVWHYKFVPETNLVDVHMGRLRRKVDGSNEAPMVRNVRGVGFVLSAPPCAQDAPSRTAERREDLTVPDKSTLPVE